MLLLESLPTQSQYILPILAVKSSSKSEAFTQLEQKLLSLLPAETKIRCQASGEQFKEHIWKQYVALEEDDAIISKWEEFKREFYVILSNILREIRPYLRSYPIDLFQIDSVNLIKDETAQIDKIIGEQLGETFRYALELIAHADGVIRSKFSSAPSSLIAKLDSIAISFVLSMWLTFIWLASSKDENLNKNLISFSIRMMRKDSSLYAARAERLARH